MNCHSDKLFVMIDLVTSVIDEVRLIFNRLIEVVEELHPDSEIRAPQRAVLEFLHRHGETTVPGIARARNVTRQHIQGIVNDLQHLALVEPRENPAHQRSPLFALTASGHQTIQEILGRERRYLTTHLHDLDEDDLRRTAATLRDLRHRL